MSVYLFCARRSCARMPPLQPNAAEIASARSVVAFLAHRRLTDERVAATISLRVRTSRGAGAAAAPRGLSMATDGPDE